MLRFNLIILLFFVIMINSFAEGGVSIETTTTEDYDEDDTTESPSGGEDGKIYKNPRNSPSAVCPRDEEQATLLGQKCLRKCSSDEDCKSKKKKCLCDGACGMSCIKPDRECPELEQPEIGTVSITGRLFGDKASYTCPHGYHVVGLQSRSCQADGQWAGKTPACKENIYCLQPPTIEHARHSALPEQATFDLDATVQYHCHTGYVTNGFPRAKCLAIDGQASWYGPDISCEPRSCGQPGDVPHGWVTAECHTFGCRALLQCGAGFELVGKSERFCQADGTWAPKELPTCVLVTAVQCPNPEAPRHGKAIYTSCAYNSVVSYECKYGYKLIGDSTRRCGANKQWSGSQPTCKEINCGHPGPLYNGWLENISAGTGLGASIIFRCHDGMTMKGNSSSICQIDGTWTNPLPKCLAPCVIPHVSQGKVLLVERNDTKVTSSDLQPTQIVGTSTMVQHGDQILVECITNYEFTSSNPSVTCNNGTWTQIPKCQPARCKRLPRSPRDGMVIAPKTDHGMKARFRCKDGFELKGNPILTCSYGNWTGETPKCVEVFCPFPGYVQNGKILLVGNMGLYDYRPYVKKVVNNKQIMYECERGYVLTEGPPGATCIGGHWRPEELPKCTLYQHPRIRWSRRRRQTNEMTSEDIEQEEKQEQNIKTREKRSAYELEDIESKLNTRNTKHRIVKRFDLPKHTTVKPASKQARIRHELMKRLDLQIPTEQSFEFNEYQSAESEIPYRLLTVFNNAGLPVGNRVMYKHYDGDYYDSLEGSTPFVVLKGGVFNRNDVSHPYLKTSRPKRPFFNRFLNKRHLDSISDGTQINLENVDKNNKENTMSFVNDMDLTAESRDIKQVRVKRHDLNGIKVDNYKSGGSNEIYDSGLTVLPLSDSILSVNDDDMTQRGKRTSRKTDKVNLTGSGSGSIVKSGRDYKGKSYRQRIPTTVSTISSENTTDESIEIISVTDTSGTNQTRKARIKSPCEPLSSEPYVNIEVVKHGRDPNITHSSGTIVRVACGKGYELNLEANMTAKCVRGRWKPDQPICDAIPCHVPESIYGTFKLGNESIQIELNVTDDIRSGEVVHFTCPHGYIVQGPSNLRCWLGEWAVSSHPECMPAPCILPAVVGGNYNSGYRSDLTVGHNTTLTVTCQTNDSEVTVRCQLGVLQPDPALLCAANETKAKLTEVYSIGSDIIREDVSQLLTLATQELNTTSTDCSPPARVQGTLLYRDGVDVTTIDEDVYTHGTEVTFKCIGSQVGDEITWNIICENGDWIGKSYNCDSVQHPLDKGSCVFYNNETNVVSFYNEIPIQEPVVRFPMDTVLQSRCIDIGKYSMTGSPERVCNNSVWIGETPVCTGLNQENDYSMGKPPTILFRHQLGPIAQSSSGKLIVYPSTVLHMECLWMRKFGNPKWKVPVNSTRKYPEGWTSDPGRDSTLEYRLSIISAVKEDSGIYVCETPARQSHQIEIVVEEVHCPVLPIRAGLVLSSTSTRMNSEIILSCANGNALIGAQKLICLPSGNWSAPMPVCESVECDDIVLDNTTQTAPSVAIMSRGVGGRAVFTCAPQYSLIGSQHSTCLPGGQWEQPYPKCVEVLCPTVQPPLNGYVLGREPYKAGDVLQFHCNTEHTLHGRPILVCQDSGRWSDAPPTCAQACTYPGTTISGRMSSVKFYYRIGETITFTCEPGYRLKGSTVLKCMRNRKWSNAIPLCTQLSNDNNLTTDIETSVSESLQRDEVPNLSRRHIDIYKTKEKPASLSHQSYRTGLNRAMADRLLRRSSTEVWKNRIIKVSKFIRKDGTR